MKITFFSNFLNHHQIPFCDELYRIHGDDFKFIAYQDVPESRIQLGYAGDLSRYPYLIESHKSPELAKKALDLCETSDVVIFGETLKKYIFHRMHTNKLSFRYSERLFKKGILYGFDPRVWVKRDLLDTRFRHKNIYLLASSAYAAIDYNFFGAYRNKAFRWGYYPELIEYDLEELQNRKKNPTIQLLWVGRFIDWKHPEMAVNVILALKERGIECHLKMIGVGPMLDKIKESIIINNLSDDIELLGSIPASKVRSYMESANIFLMTSDRNEGWGAVMNEAMNSACACFAYYLVGAAPFLISQGVNGVIYTSYHDLIDRLGALIQNRNELMRLGEQAYLTIKDTWNAKIAAERLTVLSKTLLYGGTFDFTDGPLSIAPRLTEKSMYQKIVNNRSS